MFPNSLAVKNNAAMNIPAHVRLWTSLRIPLAYTSGSRMADPWRMLILNFTMCCQNACQSRWATLHSYQQRVGVCLPLAVTMADCETAWFLLLIWKWMHILYFNDVGVLSPLDFRRFVLETYFPSLIHFSIGFLPLVNLIFYNQMPVNPHHAIWEANHAHVLLNAFHTQC